MQGNGQEKNIVPDRQKEIVAILDEVAKRLGNTRAVTRKYYVHPAVLSVYEEGSLSAYARRMMKNGNEKPTEIQNPSAVEDSDQVGNDGYTPAERLLMKILAAHDKRAVIVTAD
jgi:DNA topoisomerase IB